MPKQETEVQVVSKSIQMSPEVWEELEPLLERLDTDFAKFARISIRERMDRLNDEFAQTKARR